MKTERKIVLATHDKSSVVTPIAKQNITDVDTEFVQKLSRKPTVNVRGEVLFDPSKHYSQYRSEDKT